MFLFVRLKLRLHRLKPDGIWACGGPSRQVEVEVPSAEARWYLDIAVVPVRLRLKLHRLKPDGIWRAAAFVRLKLKLHRLKPDGVRVTLLQ